jgi:hypothetical protein
MTIPYYQSLFVLDVMTLLIPAFLGPVCSCPWSSSLEATKPLLFIEQSVSFLLGELTAIRVDDHTSGSFVLLSEFKLLLSVGLHFSLFLFYR